ncbi:MAG: filamentous hemagglutinin N-terminal domain-containing protein, partial [Rugosibacter sp.]
MNPVRNDRRFSNTPMRRPATPLRTSLGLSAAAVAACFVTGALANPADPTVVNGSASFNTAGNVLTVTNSNGAAINWNTFSIAAGETTRFVQPSASSSVLNRVLGGDPSAIYGTLASNGRVWLVNPAGIMVGPSGRIDVAGFVASTLHVSTADFLANKLSFNATPGAGNVTNQGEITTPSGGAVYLIGTHVSNAGIITTPQGETILAAGQTVSLIDTATPGVKVEITGAEGNATNLGQIVADAGRIGIAGVIVRNSGTLNASSAVSEGGKIFLRASQDAYVDGDGRIVTTGTKGGQVEVLGERVAVMDNAEIDASGVNGGGTILVGGDYQGKNPAIQNASITWFGPDAVLKADAQNLGAGGTVIVWADDTTRAYGTISARGGANGGDGGFVEVSGHRYLDFQASVDRRAPLGKAGLLLLDPADITIGNSPDDYGGAAFYGGVFSGVDNAYGSNINWATIDTQLGLGDLAITTTGSGGSGDITLIDGHDYSSSYSFSLLANNNINASGKTLANGGNGTITLVAGWDGVSTSAPAVGATMGAINAFGATFSTVGGSITLLAQDDITAGNLITSGYDGGPGLSGGAAGDVAIHSYGGGISVTSISARGGQGGDEFNTDGYSVGVGGNGGQVTLTADAGQISTGIIDASGGNGGSALGIDPLNTGGWGGDGGNITLTATATDAVTATGGLYARGGSGGAGGGEGGAGGDLTIQGASISLSNDGYSVDGGNGGAGDGILGWNGGLGGDAGSITLTATYGGIDISGGAWLAALGGAGGNGADGVDATYNPTAGGWAGSGGNISLIASGLVGLSSGSSINSSGGVGGGGGNGALGYGGATGGEGGTAGHILVDAGQITLTDSWLAARGGDGGQGGAGYGGGSATYTVTVGGTDLCGGSAASTCDGQLLTGSYGGVAYSFNAPSDQTDSATTAGGAGGTGGSVDDASGPAIMLKANSGDIGLS